MATLPVDLYRPLAVYPEGNRELEDLSPLRFDPSNWNLVGEKEFVESWDNVGMHPLLWGTEYLFRGDNGPWIVIRLKKHAVFDVPTDPTFRRLTSRQAAEWFIDCPDQPSEELFPLVAEKSLLPHGANLDASFGELLKALEKHRLTFLFFAQSVRINPSSADSRMGSRETVFRDEIAGYSMMIQDIDNSGEFLFRHRHCLDRYASEAIERFGPGEGIKAEGGTMPHWVLDDTGAEHLEDSANEVYDSAKAIRQSDFQGVYKDTVDQAVSSTHCEDQSRSYSCVVAKWSYLSVLDCAIHMVKLARAKGVETISKRDRVPVSLIASIASLGLELFAKVTDDDFHFSKSEGSTVGWVELIRLQISLGDIAPWMFDKERFRTVASGIDATFVAALDKLFHARHELYEYYEANMNPSHWEVLDGVLSYPPIPSSAIYNLEAAFLELDSLMGEGSIADDLDLPVWNGHKLFYKGKCITEYLREAKNQKAILSAFQEESWQNRIDDPLPNGRDSQRLRETVKGLNDRQTTLRFYCDGSGEGVVWELREL